MMNECRIVEDLLPLYAEGMTQEETNTFIEGHLKTCRECADKLERLKKDSIPVFDEEGELPMKSLAKAYKRDKKEVILCAVCFSLSLLLGIFSFITAPHYLTYEEAVAAVNEDTDTVTVQFTDKVKHFSVTDTGGTDRDIECWTTPLDEWWPVKSEYYTVLEKGNIWYVADRDGTDDILLSGQTSGSRQTLPRLALNFYAFLSAAASAVLAAAWLAFRKKKAGTVLFRIMLAPLCWLAANLVVERGIGSATFSIMRDFTLIALIAVSLYGGFFLLLKRYSEKTGVL